MSTEAEKLKAAIARLKAIREAAKAEAARIAKEKEAGGG